MARKRVVEPSGVKTWEDANDALRQIAEAQLAVQDIEGEMNKQILGAKKAAEEQSKPHKDRIAKLERELKDFVTEHRADMGKAKSKILTFGEVGFRLSTSVSLPRAKEKIEEIIRRLKNRQMMDCIVVKEDVSKEALKKYGEDTVNAVGATWKQQDVFGYELDFAKLEPPPLPSPDLDSPPPYPRPGPPFSPTYKPLEAGYPTMTTEALKELDVGRIAHRDAALFMWATDAHIPDALELYRAWGFRYVTVAFVWSKKTVNGKTVSNLAPWTLKNCELCLMGTRGRMVQYKQKNNIPQLVEAVRTRHSEKPEEVRRRIEELFGDVPRIELFARKRFHGWDCWGNEV